MLRAFYSRKIESFVGQTPDEVLGTLAASNPFELEPSQRDAWRSQIDLLQMVLQPYAERGTVHFEFTVPRIGKRIDNVVLIDGIAFVIEFKVGESHFGKHAVDQVWDYALDLKNFHETSQDRLVVPILVCTHAHNVPRPVIHRDSDDLLRPLLAGSESLSRVIREVLDVFSEESRPGAAEWVSGRYSPTPTIIQAAQALYGGHGVEDISRSDASAINLGRTTDAVSRIIAESSKKHRKAICFVTGVPGAGKTLVGLNIATKHLDKASELHSVFLSGNGPLVAVLCEALTRDRVAFEKKAGRKVAKGRVKSEVQLFIQNVHHFRDDCLADARPPIEHVVLFDEAQRAWDRARTASFMQRKKGQKNFDRSEPDFLVSCMDRHSDWAVVVCLVGGGQEINTGEAGITEWIDSIKLGYPDWDVHLSNRLMDAEYGERIVESARDLANVHFDDSLHLSVSMQSFRAEKLSQLMKQLLDLDESQAAGTFKSLAGRYPVVLTRSLDLAKRWVRDHARGSERYGLLASSRAQRLKPHAIDVKSPLDPFHWFLDPKSDVRSSYYLEDVATEFHVQGLELDWTCLTWDADLRIRDGKWDYRSFTGDRWNRINNVARRKYLLNAYRVLLTRARQGMVIFVPPGDSSDPTRLPEFYDPTFDYLSRIGLPNL